MSRSGIEADNKGHNAPRETQACFAAHACAMFIEDEIRPSVCVTDSAHRAIAIKLISVLLPISRSQPLVCSWALILCDRYRLRHHTLNEAVASYVTEPHYPSSTQIA